MLLDSKPVRNAMGWQQPKRLMENEYDTFQTKIQLALWCRWLLKFWGGRLLKRYLSSRVGLQLMMGRQMMQGLVHRTTSHGNSAALSCSWAMLRCC